MACADTQSFNWVPCRPVCRHVPSHQNASRTTEQSTGADGKQEPFHLYLFADECKLLSWDADSWTRHAGKNFKWSREVDLILLREDEAAHRKRSRVAYGSDVLLTNKGVAISVYLPSTSVGNMHSTRSSCAVMHCGVPTVVIKEK